MRMTADRKRQEQRRKNDNVRHVTQDTEPRLQELDTGSPVHLPEHDVDRAQHRGGVREHVALHHEVHRLEVAEKPVGRILQR